jgi:hypothetical protein
MVDYYDKLLVAIPSVVLLGATAGLYGPVTVYQGLAAGSLLATLVLFEMLYRNPPTERRARVSGAVTVGLSWLLTTLSYLGG